MKNNKAFTLIELLAVVVILGILMMIAIPNTVSLIDKNRKKNYIENAKTFISLVKNKVETDKSIELPMNSSSATIVNLEYLNTSDIEDSPYGDEYDKYGSFVAITLENNKYVYYVQLISCTSSSNCERDIVSNWNGISLVEESRLDDDNRYSLFKTSGVNANLIDFPETSTYLSGKRFNKYTSN